MKGKLGDAGKLPKNYSEKPLGILEPILLLIELRESGGETFVYASLFSLFWAALSQRPSAPLWKKEQPQRLSNLRLFLTGVCGAGVDTRAAKALPGGALKTGVGRHETDWRGIFNSNTGWKRSLRIFLNIKMYNLEFKFYLTGSLQKCGNAINIFALTVSDILLHKDTYWKCILRYIDEICLWMKRIKSTWVDVEYLFMCLFAICIQILCSISGLWIFSVVCYFFPFLCLLWAKVFLALWGPIY